MIRKAQEPDIPRIIQLLHQVNMVHYEKRPDLFRPHTTKYSEQELQAMLGCEQCPIFVYDDGGVHGQHIGKALFEFVREYAKSIGCRNITLNVWEGNAPALSFYRNMGMQVQKTTMEIIIDK